VRHVLAELSDPQRVTGGWVGFVPREQTGARDAKLVVESVDAAGPAASAGLKPGEAVLAVGGKSVSTSFQLNKLLMGYRLGDSVDLEVADAAGKHREVSIEIRPVPQTPEQRLILDRLGFVGRNVTEEEVAGGLPRGYLVTEVRHGSDVYELGLQAGDVFMGIIEGRYRILVRDETELLDLLKRIKSGTFVEIAISRGGTEKRGGPVRVE
jgi:S1-C subfamily serine protease